MGPGLPAGSSLGLTGSLFSADPFDMPLADDLSETLAASCACAIMSFWYCWIFLCTSELFRPCPAGVEPRSRSLRFFSCKLVGIDKFVGTGVETRVVSGDW